MGPEKDDYLEYVLNKKCLLKMVFGSEQSREIKWKYESLKKRQ